ncbi:lipopolysaccharide assembly protein LapA domain-containing protein [Salinisphaera sp.]|uniref:lipopolysaccharide assembly protein LapA domain-containing protein n=1 Tax=Salinisphaera sp. TaxID=1914330 RepID=UPI002D784728|nr:lipopolysaccharide assembly protein LapA domain-containing protein [Salinisphaera sp.]HET7315074.1 lipopolysaccharide assembly protein LapA domain-containing protein [Salinisphaera sp.]
MLRLIRNLIIILALFIGLAFGFFNYGSTPVDLLWTTTEAPLAVLLGLAFLLGLVIALVVCGVRMAKLRSRLSRTRRRLKHAEAEITNLRSMPIYDA